MSVLITVTQIIFWDCRVHFNFLLFSSDILSGNNFVKLTAHLQLDIYDNLHSHFIYVFSKSVQVGEEEGSVGGGGGAAQRGTNWYSKTQLQKLHKFSNFNYIIWEKRFFPFLVNVLLLFHIDIPRYVFRAQKTHKKTLNKMKGAVREVDWNFSFSLDT